MRDFLSKWLINNIYHEDKKKNIQKKTCEYQLSSYFYNSE